MGRRTGIFGHVAAVAAAVVMVAASGGAMADVLAEHTTRDGVECSRGDGVGVLDADGELESLAHLPGGFVGERDAEDVGRRDAELVDEMRDTTDQHAGLAGAGAGEHFHGDDRGEDGGALLVVHAFQVGHRRGRRGLSERARAEHVVGRVRAERPRCVPTFVPLAFKVGAMFFR